MAEAEAGACPDDTPEVEQRVLRRIDDSRVEIFKHLNTFIKFRSISKQAEALDATKQWLQALGFIIAKETLEQEHDASTGAETILASYFAGFQNVTVLIYADLVTPPAEKSDGWSSDPFALCTKNNVLYGRGVTSGKGQLICWLHALEAWQAEIGKLPLNIQIIITSGHVQLDAHLNRRKNFFAHVDYVMMFNNSWLNDHQPLLPCNINGSLQLGVQVKSIQAPSAAATQGYQFVHTAFNDLCRLMNTLVNAEQHILVPQIERHCRNISAAERLLLEATECKQTEVTKAAWLSRRWCRPTLTMHDVEHPLSRQGKTLYTPTSATAKVSIKLVPEQNTRYVAALVKDFLKHNFKNLNSNNQLIMTVLEQYAPFYSNRRSTHIAAVCRALYRTHNVEAALPSSICHCVPIAQLLRAHCKKPFIFVPYAKFNASAQAVNECMHVEFYLRNIKLAASLLWEIAQLHVKCSAMTTTSSNT